MEKFAIQALNYIVFLKRGTLLMETTDNLTKRFKLVWSCRPYQAFQWKSLIEEANFIYLSIFQNVFQVDLEHYFSFIML